MDTPRELSYGEKAVGLTFNPSGDAQVSAIKAAYATIIDHLNDMRADVGPGEKGRLLSVAITEAQTAQMWAVKGITWQDAAPVPPTPPADAPAAPQAEPLPEDDEETS